MVSLAAKLVPRLRMPAAETQYLSPNQPSPTSPTCTLKATPIHRLGQLLDPLLDQHQRYQWHHHHLRRGTSQRLHKQSHPHKPPPTLAPSGDINQWQPVVRPCMFCLWPNLRSSYSSRRLLMAKGATCVQDQLIVCGPETNSCPLDGVEVPRTEESASSTLTVTNPAPPCAKPTPSTEPAPMELFQAQPPTNTPPVHIPM